MHLGQLVLHVRNEVLVLYSEMIHRAKVHFEAELRRFYLMEEQRYGRQGSQCIWIHHTTLQEIVHKPWTKLPAVTSSSSEVVHQQNERPG